jgi:hypothetical protein
MSDDEEVELPIMGEPSAPRRRPVSTGARFWLAYAIAHGAVAFLALVLYLLRSDAIRAPVPAWPAHLTLVLAFWPVTILVVVLLVGCMSSVAAEDGAKMAGALWEWLWDTSLPGTAPPARPPSGSHASPLM